MTNDNGDKYKTIMDKMFDPNFLKAFPFLVIPAAIGAIFSLILIVILPTDLLQRENAPGQTMILIPFVIIGMMFLLRYMLKIACTFDFPSIC